MFVRCRNLLQYCQPLLQRSIATFRQSRPNASVPKRVLLPTGNPSHNFDPVAIQATLDKLPYFVARTTVGKNLPIYTDFKRGGTKKLTIIRRVYGNPLRLKEDLAKVFPDNEIIVRPAHGQVIIDGNYVEAVRHFLTFKGF